MTEGKIIAIRNVVVDVEFKEEETPKVYDALIIELKEKKLVLEVESILSQGRVRTVAMGDVYGLTRGKNPGKDFQCPWRTS